MRKRYDDAEYLLVSSRGDEALAMDDQEKDEIVARWIRLPLATYRESERRVHVFQKVETHENENRLPD